MAGTMQAARHELVVVDATLPEAAGLAALLAGSAGDRARVVVIDPGTDGIEAVTRLLEGMRELDALHLVGHGADGVLFLGSSGLDAAEAQRRAATLVRWHDALRADADILLYGCRSAWGLGGERLLATLSQLTGADVAASDNFTGSARLGGDWVLEAHVGAIETRALAPAEPGAWDHVLEGGPVNQSPTVSAPASFTVTEDVAGNLTYTGTPFADVDSATLTVTLSIDDGTIAATTGGGVTVGGSAVSRTFSGSIADLNSYFTTAGNITYTAALDNTTARTLTTLVSDGSLSASETSMVNITAVNDAPVLGGAPGGLVGWWRLDETAGATAADASGNGHSGTLVNMDPSSDWGAGRVGGALDFDGVNDFVQVANDAALTPANAITVAAWIRPTATMTSYARIASSGNYWEAWHFTSSPSGSNDLIVWMGNGVRAQTAPNVLRLDEWQHVAFTYDKDAGGTDEVRIYIDGVLAATGDYSAAISPTSQPLWIGSAGNPASNLFTGKMDDVRIYNRALSVTEVQRLALTASNLTSISEDDTTSAGNTVAGIVPDGSITDADYTPASSAPEAIAITAVDAANGTWQHRIGAGPWTDIDTAQLATQALLLDGTDSVRFVPNANWNGTATFTYRAWDRTGGTTAGTYVTIAGTGGSTPYGIETGTATITVSAVNDAPVFTGTAGAAYTENAVAVAIVSGAAVSDVDAAHINGGSVTVSLAAYQAGDTLSINNQGSSAGQIGVSGANVTFGGTAIGSFTGGSVADLVISLNSDATPAAVQALMGQLRYASSAEDPTINGTATTRALTVTLNDGGNSGSGGAQSASRAGTITITAATDAPVIGGAGNTRSYAENGAAVTLESALTVNDADDTQIASGSVTISAGFTAGDTLTWTNQAGISAGYNAGTGVLTLSGNATLATYQALLASVAYSSTSEDPTATSASRTITWSLTDANSDGAGAGTGTATTTVNLSAVNDAPVNAVPGAQSTNENTALVFSSPNGNLISIGDVDAAAVTVQLQLGVTNGTLTLAGTAGLTLTAGANGSASMTYQGSVADLNVALAGMSYTPTASYSGPATLTIVTSDLGNTGSGGTLTDTDTVAITVTAVSHTPTVSAPASFTVTEDVAGNLVFAATPFADMDSATLTVTLSIDDGTIAAASGGGVTVAGTATARTFSGSVADLDSFFTTAGNITYTTALDNTTARTLTTTVSDGALSASATSSVSITAVNDAPAVSAPASLTVTEDVASPITSISISDPDAGNATVLVTLSVAAGTLSAASGGGVAVGGSAAACTLTGTFADINAFIAAGNVSYTTAADASGTTTLLVSTNDQGNSGSGGTLSTTATVTLAITPVNDAPVLGPAHFGITHGGSVTLAPGAFSATDVETPFASLVFTVSNVKGGSFVFAAAPGTPITAFSGAQLQSGAVRFVHAGGPATFDVSASDGTLATPAVAGTIDVATEPPRGGEGVVLDFSPPNLPVVENLREARAAPGPAAPAGAAAPAAPPPAPAVLTLPVPRTPKPAPAPAQEAQEKPAEPAAGPPGTVALAAPKPEVSGPLPAPGAAPPRLLEEQEPTPEPELAIDLASMASGLDAPVTRAARLLAAVRVAGLCLSAGVVTWVLRAGGLLSGLMASLPAWRHVDPLPILARGRRDAGEDEWHEPEADAGEDARRVDAVLSA